MPLDTALESEAVDAVRALAPRFAVNEDDLVILLDQALRDWSAYGVVAPVLRDSVAEALQVGADSFGAINGGTYFALYKRLRAGTDDAVGLSHTLARRLLSRTSLIAHLLSAERLSCSQIARLLHSTENSLSVPHAAVQVIARALSLLPALDAAEVGDDLWRTDQERALTLFPDSNLVETCEVTGLEAAKWAPEANTAELLITLCRANAAEEIRWPYLQILHWCTTALEFYDHPASYLYEFGPRGAIGIALFGRYPTVTGNPVLNNAKAVETLNATWARNRGGDDSHALVELLRLLESLPFSARRQVARVFRSWLIRVIELETVEPTLLNMVATIDDFTTVTSYITTSETNTQGVIEQCVVDCLATLAFDRPGWRSKGIGDGINWTNLSQHKLGDVEFTNVNSRTAIALEAHGGHLSAVYVRDHQRSLARIVEQRLVDSWADLDDPANWSIRVVFVAHSRDADGLPDIEVMHGVRVQYEYIDYAQLRDAAIGDGDPEWHLAVFNELVVAALNKTNIRQSARDKFVEIIATGMPPVGI
ncbi:MULTISPECIES: hypothetical protein [unclassified Leifsonia]|uniref:hypothetical protein n=1 Tax=unclassified Leifsonia TaxID=2663824 RepID=UPI001113E82D|nr:MULTISPECIES: hypothetical protein [unclassified Leifsonia]